MVKPELQTDCHRFFQRVLFGQYRFKYIRARTEKYGHFHINIQALGSF